MAGTLGIAGSLTVTLSNPGYRPTQGTQFEIMTFASYTGIFAAMSGLDLGNRLQLVPAYTNNALTLTAVQGGSGTWNTDANGVISAASNWANGVPGEAGDGATFGPVISSPRTVTVDVPTTFGSMTFQSANSYTIAGSNSITLQVPGGSPQITVLAGSHTVSAPLVLAGNLAVSTSVGDSLELSGDVSGEAASLTLSGGGQLILSGSNLYGGGTVVNAGTLYVTNSAALPDGTSLTVGAGGTFVFEPSVAAAPIAAFTAGGHGSTRTLHFRPSRAGCPRPVSPAWRRRRAAKGITNSVPARRTGRGR